MKTLIILLLISLNSFASPNCAPESTIRAMTLNQPIAGKECKDAPLEACYCFDGMDVRDAKLIDNLVVDFIRKEQESACLDEIDCQSKLEALVCANGSPIKNLESMSVYCAIEFMKVDGKKLVIDPAKKAARELAEKAKADAEKVLEAKCKSFSFKGTTIAALRAELNESLECK